MTDVTEMACPSINARFYSGAEKHGTITGSGPNFDSAMRRFKERQRQDGLPGKWMCGANQGNVSKGTRRDARHFIVNW